MSTPPENPEDRRAQFQLELAAGEYHDLFIASKLGVPEEVLPNLRAQYVRDVKKNPIALWSVAEWWFMEGRKSPRADG